MKKLVIREKEGIWAPDRGHGEIVLYRERSGAPGLEVRLAGETLWLNQAQMARLFDRDQSVIARHLRNVFKEGELTPSKSNMQKMHNAISDKPVLYYNLDVILSVGYRVNSKRGTQFRIWATNVLKQHIVRGYTENARRLHELRRSLQLVEHVLDRHDVSSDEAKALLRVVTDYSYALDLLDDYDHQRVPAAPVQRGEVRAISYAESRRLIDLLREKFGAPAIFGQEKDDSLHSSLNAILQTFNRKDVYPGLEEKAAHLLYFLVKNHSFIDGNKRIAAALFLWFMEKNKLLYGLSGEKRISDVTLVALTLMVAESAPREKDPIIRIVMNLISKRT